MTKYRVRMELDATYHPAWQCDECGEGGRLLLATTLAKRHVIETGHTVSVYHERETIYSREEVPPNG